MSFPGLSFEQAPAQDIPLRFFLSAPVFLFFAGLLLTWEGAALFQSSWNSSTIALTHLLTLGWMANIMMGAVYQIVPVMIGGKIPQARWSRWVHYCLNLGILLFVGGIYFSHPHPIYTAIPFLFIAFALFAWQANTALFRLKSQSPTALGMRISLLSLWGVFLVGLWMLAMITGLLPMSAARESFKLAHLILALGGWVGTLILGVSYHVVPMFYLGPEFPKPTGSRLLLTLASLLVFSVLSLFLPHSDLLLHSLSITGELVLVLYAVLMFRVLKKRKRKRLDASLKVFRLALLGLFLLPLVHATGLLTQSDKLLSGVVALYIGIFCVGITGGMLLKVVPFLVWLHRFSSDIGKLGVPNIKQILTELDSLGWYLLYLTFAVFLFGGVLSLALPGEHWQTMSDFLFRSSGVFLCLLSAWTMFILGKSVFGFRRINDEKTL